MASYTLTTGFRNASIVNIENGQRVTMVTTSPYSRSLVNKFWFKNPVLGFPLLTWPWNFGADWVATAYGVPAEMFNNGR